MFDIGATELLLVVIVALLVIGPKDLPLAMRTAGRWMGKMRAMTKHFRSGIDAMIREAELDEQEKIWAERNAKIMSEHPQEDTMPGDVMQEGQGSIPQETPGPPAEGVAPAPSSDDAPKSEPAAPSISGGAVPPPASDDTP